MNKNAMLFMTMLLVVFAVPMGALAQTYSHHASVEVTAEIVGIDHASREITLEGPEGNIVELYAGPQVARFDELKVGDTVTFRYYESVVTQIRKPGETPAASDSEESEFLRGGGAKPSGIMARQITAAVTITHIDENAPSVTVKTEDGRTMTFDVAHKQDLEGLKKGDHVVITYTAALAVNVN